MATNDIPSFDGPEAERGIKMQALLKEAGKTRVSELSALFNAPVTWDGIKGFIDYIGADGKVRATLESGRQPYCKVDDLQPDGAGFTYTTPEG